MGFSRVLLNIVSLGAASRVDKAKSRYDCWIQMYKLMVEEMKETQRNIKLVLSAEEAWQKFKKNNRPVLESLNRNTNLPEETRAVLKKLETELSIHSQNKDNFQLSEDFELRDTTSDNVDGTVATLVLNLIPFGGVIAAHSIASDEIKEIEKLTDEIQVEIKRMEAVCSQINYKLKERNEAFRHIKEVLEKNGFSSVAIPYVELHSRTSFGFFGNLLGGLYVK